MNTRREFLGLLASASGAFLLPPGLRAAVEEGVKLRVGVLSDLHLDFGHSYGEYWKLERALAYFRDQNVDAVVVCGDVANNGLVGEFEAFAKMWYGFFPGDRRRDGGQVERVFVFGNHDVGNSHKMKSYFPYEDEAGLEKYKILNCYEKMWRECFHEEFQPFFAKDVKGYTFIGSHWRSTAPKHVFEPVELPGYLRENAAKLGKEKPFFFVQHCHPRGTCHGQDAWWPDSGKNTTEVLKDFPNAVCLSGHSHDPITDLKAVWQGGFTSIGCGSLCYSSPLGNDPTPDIRAAAVAPEGHPWQIDGGSTHVGQLIEVHDGFLVVKRREFRYKTELGKDLVVPVPVKSDPEYGFEKRKAALRPPRYATPPKVEIRETEKDQLVTFPAVKQDVQGFSRVYGYDFTATPKDGSKPFKVNIRAAGSDMPLAMEPDTVIWHAKKGTFTSAADYDFTVVPFDSFRTRAV